MKNLVLTSGDGWLGRALVNEFTNEQNVGFGRYERLICGVLDSRNLHSTQYIEYVEIDLREKATLPQLFANAGDFDLVHNAGIIHPRKVSDFDEVNVHGTINILSAANDFQLDRATYISSNSPMGNNPTPDSKPHNNDPFNPYMGYGMSKMNAELAVQKFIALTNKHVVVLRPPWFYGPFQPQRQARFIRSVRSGRFPIIGDGLQVRSMINVRNLVHAIDVSLKANVASGNAYWVADIENYTIAQIVKETKQAALDNGLEVVDRDLRLPNLVANVSEKIDRSIQKHGRYIAEIHVAGELNKHIFGSISDAKLDLSFAPQISLRDGMREAIKWAINNGQEV
jgi:nucleoside-diphosphate-sugar epimerase